VRPSCRALPVADAPRLPCLPFRATLEPDGRATSRAKRAHLSREFELPYTSAMPVDPDVQAIIREFEAAAEGAPPIHELTADEVRTAYAEMVSLQGPPEDVARVEDLEVGGPVGPIPIRLYHPSSAQTHPAIQFSHGGGWVIWDLDSHDPLCRALANAAGAVVVAAHYRRAPEAKFPVAVHDCYAVLDWIAGEGQSRGLDPHRIALAGDSAGANLSAAVALLARDRDGPQSVAQVLHCPSTMPDLSGESHREYGEDYLLTREQIEWYRAQYLRDESDARDPLFAPSLAPNLEGLPPTLIQTAQYDPLRDDGVTYAERLREAGVDVTYEEIRGVIHDPWVMMGAVRKGRQSLESAAAFLRERFA